MLFSVEYFVYRQFKMYYDPTTVLLGASDVASTIVGGVSSYQFIVKSHVAIPPWRS